MDDEFGRLLKGLRVKAGKTQQEMAEACGVPAPSLRNWEQGRRRPDLGTAYRLALALGVNLGVLGEAAARVPLRGARPSPTPPKSRKKRP